MARLPYLRYDDAPDAVREVLDGYPPHIRDRHIFGILGHAHDAFGPMIRYGRSLVTQSELPAHLREIAVLRVSHLTPGARYLWVEHVPIALALGVGQDQVDALASDDLAVLGDDERLVARFTDQVVRDATPDDATWEQMTARFSPRQIVELMLAIGHFMTFSRIHATVRVELEDDRERPPVDTTFFGAKRNQA
jgi:4-carboxymuconolactone decarboxylase